MQTSGAPRKYIVVIATDVGKVWGSHTTEREERAIEALVDSIKGVPGVACLTSVYELNGITSTDTSELFRQLHRYAVRRNARVILISRNQQIWQHRCAPTFLVYAPNLGEYLGHGGSPGRLARFSRFSMLRFIAYHLPTIINRLELPAVEAASTFVLAGTTTLPRNIIRIATQRYRNRRFTMWRSRQPRSSLVTRFA